MSATTADGPTDAYATERLRRQQASETRRREIASLYNYLKNKFKLYVTMKLDHTEEIEGHVVNYHAKENDYTLNLSAWHYDLGYIALTLRNQYNVKNPNARSKWINI